MSAPASRIGVGSVATSSKARDLVGAVLDSEWYSPGKMCARFEREWARKHSADYGIFVNSGTSALELSLAALKEQRGWQKGDGIIVPAVTFVASVNVILRNGLRPIFVDVDEFYGLKLNLRPPSHAVGIMPVHINGQSCDMDDVVDMAEVYNLAVVEDSCEAVGVKWRGQSVGSFGDTGCFSQYACHHVTCGVGGMVVTTDPELARLVRSLANHGRDGIPRGANDVISKRFRFERVGFSYRATEFEAAVGIAQMPDLDQNLRKRRENAERLNAMLDGLPLVLPKARPGADWAPMFYPVLSDRRDELCESLESRDIETRYFLPLVSQPVYANLINEDDFPFAARVDREGLYVGCHPGLTDQDLTRIATAFHDFF